MIKYLFLRKPTVFVIVLSLLLFLAAILILKPSHDRQHMETTKDLSKVSIINPEYKYFIKVFEGEDVNELKSADCYYSTEDKKEPIPENSSHTITFLYQNQRPGFVYYNKTMDIFHNKANNRLSLSKALEHRLKELIRITDLAIQKTYGRLLPWEEVKKIFPNMTIARVVDFRTGLSFTVQRRAGSSHADVQPLTAQDTAVMKEIYGGVWSWDRRAIILEVDGYRIASSMTGMPHGCGKIKDNNFDGHFCIHFLNSTTHTSGNVDKRHLEEILKAAGKLP
ncbi:MAG TPA: hypothetical protein GXZ32_06890 [Clostridiales bacterium]|nr:hypothetical protein [Clostridiales bacterium]